MKKKFEDYLIEKGYKQYTKDGKPSTVYDYVKRVESVCNNEGCDWDALANNISIIVQKYDKGGQNEDFGSKSHDAVINALKRFRDFING